jgi:hypothetical protein
LKTPGPAAASPLPDTYTTVSKPWLEYR